MTFRHAGSHARPLFFFLMAAFLGSLSAPMASAASMKEMVGLGVRYFKKKNFGSAYKVWRRVGDKLVEKKVYERPGKVKTVAKIRYLIGYALFKSKKYQGAARYWRQTLSLVPRHPKALKGLRRLAKAKLIGPEEVSPDPNFPPRDDEPDVLEPPPKPGPDETKDETKDPEVPEQPPIDALAGINVTADPSRARAAWDEGKQLLQFGQADQAIEKLKEAYKYGRPKVEIDYQLGHAFLKSELSENAVYHFKEALDNEEGEDQREVYLGMGKAYSLSDDVNKEIASYERILQLDPDYGEAHFMLALAYDKVDNSPKVLEHAQKAIRIDPEYKEKLKPRIKDSNVSKKIGRIVSNVLKDSKYERLTDEKIEEYAEEIGRILGEENLNTEEFMGNGGGRQKLRSALQDVKNGKDFKSALNDHIPKNQQKDIKKAFLKNRKLRNLASQIKKKYK